MTDPTASPVEFVDVLDVPEQSADLLRADRQVALIDDVGQVVLRGGGGGQTGANHSAGGRV